MSRHGLRLGIGAWILLGLLAGGGCGEKKKARKPAQRTERTEYVELAEKFAHAIDENTKDCSTMGKLLAAWQREHGARYRELGQKHQKLPGALWGRHNNAIAALNRAETLCVKLFKRNQPGVVAFLAFMRN